MMDADLVCKWIQVMLPHGEDLSMNRRLLIMDSFRAHLTTAVKAKCAQHNLIQAVIPGGLTGELQPLDIAVNRSFKALLRQHLLHAASNLERKPKEAMDHFHLRLLCRAVRRAWSDVKPSIIRTGFRKMMMELDACQAIT